MNRNLCDVCEKNHYDANKNNMCKECWVDLE
jgi:hypothetical protein